MSKRYFYWLIIITILILFLFFFFLKSLSHREDFVNNNNNNENEKRPILWSYWETMEGKKRPAYIDLCYASLLHNCRNCFQIIRLDEKKIYQYLPELRDGKIASHLKTLSIPHKADYYRYALLEKYGGVWIDADIIATKCLCPLYQKLLESDKDYMGFGCGRNRGSCSANMDGKGDPTNWLMMSKPKTAFMKCLRKNAENTITGDPNFSYHAIGKKNLKSCIEQMGPDWDYLHLPSKCQEYDSQGNKLNNILQPFQTKDCSRERYFFPLYNTAPGYPDWFKDLSLEELISNRGQENIYLREILNEAFSHKPEHQSFYISKNN